MLVIEVDGAHHAEGETFENDQVRDARLQQLNYKVLRFTNKLVLENPEAVLKTIAGNFQKQKAA